MLRQPGMSMMSSLIQPRPVRADRLVDLRPAHFAGQIEQLARLQRQAQNPVLVHRAGKLHPSRRQARKTHLA